MRASDFQLNDPVTYDYHDHNEQLAADIDDLLENNTWLSNFTQRHYVVEVVERTLSKLERTGNRTKVSEYRTEAQTELLNEIPDEHVKDKQTIQAACHTRLFKGHEPPRRNYRGEKQWHDLFDNLILELHRKRK